MEIKLSKHILSMVEKIHKNIEQNTKYAEKMNGWLNRFDMEFNDMELIYSKIVKGEVIKKNGKYYLKTDSNLLAESNNDGTYCHQVNDYEDCYHGEIYFRIDEERFLQIFYDA